MSSARSLRVSRLFLLGAAFAPTLLLAGETGSLATGSPYLRPGLASPITASQRFVLDAPGLDLAAGVALPLTAPDGAILVLVPRSGAAIGAGTVFALTGADGQRREAGKAFSGVAKPRGFNEPDLAAYDLPAAATVLELGRIDADRYTLRGETSDVAAVLVAEPNSNLVMRTRATPLAARSGEPVIVEAFLLAGDEAVAGATIKARWSDGAGGHELLLTERRPGRYAGRIVPVAGEPLTRIDLRIDAAGSLADGTAFARTSLAGTMVTRNAADVDAGSIELGADGLAVSVAGAPGRYRLEATFARTNGGADDAAEGLAYSREDFVLGAERQSVVLALPAAAAGADRVALRLLNIGTLGVELELELDLAVPGEPLAAALRAGDETKALPASKLRARARFNEEP